MSDDVHLKELDKTRYVFYNKAFLDYDFEDGVYVATGPRQIGKTTHLKLLIRNRINEKNKNNFLYFNCDILENKSDMIEMVEKYLKHFDSLGRKYILLDEITAVKDGILAIKYLIDSGMKKDITYIVTGSSTVNIKKTGEYLPGRRGAGVDFHFGPVSFADFLAVQYPLKFHPFKAADALEKYFIDIKKNILLQKELDKYLICGGIPKVINDYLFNGNISLDSFYLYRDWIVSETAKNGKREQVIKIILERIISSIGSDVSYNSFASDSSIGSHNTVYDYLNFLEDAFVIRQVYNYDYHQKKMRLRKNKKFYLNDPFLFWLLRWWLEGDLASPSESMGDSMLKSRLIENICYSRLSSLFSDIYFYREKEEIDFIVKNMAWECKYQSRISAGDLGELLKFAGAKFVITKETFKISDGCQFLPVELFLLLPKKYFEK